MNLNMQNFAALFCGLLFGAGLVLSGMTDPHKVLGFLDITGQWDPTLMFVMGGALCVTVIAFRFVLKMDHPVLGSRFFLPTLTEIDPKLLAGAALFGMGWGLVGYCPGPALVSLGYLQWQPVLFVLCMLLAGKFAGGALDKFFKR